MEMDLERASKDYERDGVALIPGVFTRTETDQIRAAAIMALRGAGPDAPYRSGQRLQIVEDESVPHRARFPALLFWPVLSDEWIHDGTNSTWIQMGRPAKFLNCIRTDTRLAGIVRHFLGDDVKQLNNQVYYRLPGDGDAFNWHQDVMFRKGLADGHSIAEDYLQTVICVDRMDGENGALLFKVGSHRLGNRNLTDKAHLREYPDIQAGGIPAEVPEIWRVRANPGDVLIWNVLTIHGSLPNTSDRPRMTYMNGFCRARSSEAWPWYLKAGKVQLYADPETIPYT